jgi:LmbE family N-acetylglucosaminyl deacetylase
MSAGKRFLVFGAHPDDADLMFGGTALRLIAAGHKVKFVSCCNGNCGHFSMNPEGLAAHRYSETQASAKIVGLEEYQVLDNSDCCLEASLANRKQIVKIVREFKPDVVISHRIYDYMADHRAAAQLVQDSSYLVTVPMFCPEYAVPQINPIYMFSYDAFKKPCPFSPDIAVAIDDVLERKLEMLNCHESQFYEWLPYNQGRLEDVPEIWDERKKYLTDGWIKPKLTQEGIVKEKLKSRYGEKASTIKYAETFELSEYGRQPEVEELNELFPL